MKTKRPDIPETAVNNLDTVDMDNKALLSVKVCNRFGLSCSFCKQNILHPSPQGSDWSDNDWTRAHESTQKEMEETNLLSDWELPKHQSEPDSKPEVDKLDMGKLHLEHDNPQEEQIKVTNSLIPPPTMDKEEKAITEEMVEVETRYQEEEEKYMLQQKIYIGQLSKEEESNNSSEYSGYSYFS